MEICLENQFTGVDTIIKLDYSNLPICCRVCLSTDHMVKDCPGMFFKVNVEMPAVQESGDTYLKNGVREQLAVHPATNAAGVQSTKQPQRSGPSVGSNLPSSLPLAPGQILSKIQLEPLVERSGHVVRWISHEPEIETTARIVDVQTDYCSSSLKDHGCETDHLFAGPLHSDLQGLIFAQTKP